jgi:hypothetical protein
MTRSNCSVGLTASLILALAVSDGCSSTSDRISGTGGAAVGTGGAGVGRGGATGSGGTGGDRQLVDASDDAGLAVDGSVSINGDPVATFDSGLDGFVLNSYHDTESLNLGDPISAAPSLASLTFDLIEGSPTPGCLEVVAPYSGANQYVDVQKAFGTGGLQNWAGGTLHVRVKVATGTFTGGVQPYVDTGTSYIFGGTFTDFGAGSGWQEFILPVSEPMSIANVSGYDPASVIAFGLQLNTGSTGVAATPVTFFIDSSSLTGAPAGG